MPAVNSDALDQHLDSMFDNMFDAPSAQPEPAGYADSASDDEDEHGQRGPTKVLDLDKVDVLRKATAKPEPKPQAKDSLDD